MINYGRKTILQKSEVHPFVGIISHLQQWAYPTQSVKTEKKITTTFILSYRCQKDLKRITGYCFKVIVLKTVDTHIIGFFLEKIVKSLYVSGLIDGISFRGLKEMAMINNHFKHKSLSSVVKFERKLKIMRNDKTFKIYWQTLCFKLSYLYFDNVYT